MSNRLFLGVDPGKKGALALISDDKSWLWDMPWGDGPRLELFREIEQQHGKPRFTAVEYLKAGPHRGSIANYEIGFSCGTLASLMRVFEWPKKMVTPYDWQRKLGCAKRGQKSYRDHKKELWHCAEHLFPGSGVTLQQADALLLAEYARRFAKETGRV